MLCSLRGKSTLPLLNEKVKVVNSCVKKYVDLKICGSKLVVSRIFTLYKSICDNGHAMVLTGMKLKPPKNINYVLVECNSFLKLLIPMKVSLLMIYTQEHISECEGIKIDSIIQWRFFVIHKLMSSWIIGFHVYK